MNNPAPDIQNEVVHACKALRQADFVPQEQLEIIATDVFLRVTALNEGLEDTTLINRIRAEILDYVSSLGIRVLPIRRWASQRLDGPVNGIPRT